MEPRRNPPEYFLEIFADSNSVKDVLKGDKLPLLSSHEIERLASFAEALFGAFVDLAN